MKYKIAFIDHTSQIGGAEVSLINLLNKLDRNIFEPYLICPSQGDLSHEVEKLKVNIIFFSVEKYQKDNKKQYIESNIKLRKILKKNMINLIHANSYLAGEGVWLASKISNIKMICHVRDFIPEWWFGRAHKFMLNSNVTNIAISNSVKTHLLKNGIIDNKINVIYNGVDFNLFNGKNVKEDMDIEVKDNIINVGIVGQIIPWKGHREFIEAISILIKNYKYKNIFFYIVGDAIFNNKCYIDELKQLIKKLQIDNYVKFVGYKTDIPSVMNRLDILVSASWAEPFGRVIIEAMAMRKAVIASNAGGAPELVDENKTGLLFETKNALHLSQCIATLVDNKEMRYKYGNNGYKKSKESFSIDTHVNNIEKLYKNILS